MLAFVPAIHALRGSGVVRRRVCRGRPSPPRACASTPVEHRDVPEGHRSLHDALYGDGDSHGDDVKAAAFHNDGESRIDFEEALQLLDGPRTSGVYRVIDCNGAVSYVGMSRDIALSLRSHHMQHGAKLVSAVHIRTFAFPQRARLERVRDEWLSNLTTLPIGNTNGWTAAASASKAAMSEERRAQFESTKRKLRQAMADADLYRENNETLNEEHMRSAVEENDWSAEIERQTSATIVSPFAKATAGQRTDSTTTLALTESNIEHILDDVRPLLQADGGDVEYIGVTDGVIAVRLVGACGTCSAASTTLSQGIERALRAAFGDAMVALKEVGKDSAPSLSVATVDAVLDTEVRGAMAVLGGSVRVVEASDGTVKLRVNGGDNLRYGVELVVREKVAGVRHVAFVD